MLREKTQYIYGEAGSPLEYSVVEERRLKDSTDYAPTLFGYDARYPGNPTSVTKKGIADVTGIAMPDIIERTEYDLFGNVTRMVDGKGNDTLLTRDALGRVVKELTPIVGNERCEKSAIYDDEKNIITSSDENEDITRVEYSGLGLPIKAYLANGKYPSDNDALAEEYLYDSQLRFTQEIKYDGVGTRKENVINSTRYRYDAEDRVISMEIPQARYCETNRYDACCYLPYDNSRKGLLQEVTVAGEDGAPDVVSASYSNCLGFEEAQYLAGELKGLYALDLAGNKLSQTDGLGNVTTLAVDYAGRTISVTKPFGTSAVTASTGYDALGNRVSAADFLGSVAQRSYDVAADLSRARRRLMPETPRPKTYMMPPGN